MRIFLKIFKEFRVYLSKICVDGIFYYGLASVGNKPTYNGKEKILEVFILDFNQDIYNKEVEVYFLDLIRKKVLKSSKMLDGTLIILWIQKKYQKN